MLVRRHELTDAEWAILQPLLPPQRGRGRPFTDHRTILNGIFWRLKTGVPWRDLPARYGPWETVYSRFVRISPEAGRAFHLKMDTGFTRSWTAIALQDGQPFH